MKQCSKCPAVLPATDEFFYRAESNRDGLRSWCKKCSNAIRKAAYAKNPEYFKTKARAWAEKNPERVRENARIGARRRYRANPEKGRQAVRSWQARNRGKSLKSKLAWHFKNRERSLANNRRWKSKNKQHIKEYKKLNHAVRLMRDLDYRLRILLRNRIKKAVRAKGTKRCASTEQLIGCTVEQLRVYLERLFSPGMTWDNYGPDGWHVDHIKPCARFDLTKPEQQRECFHYSNLQPLWKLDNLSKGDRLPHEWEAAKAAMPQPELAAV